LGDEDGKVGQFPDTRHDADHHISSLSCFDPGSLFFLHDMFPGMQVPEIRMITPINMPLDQLQLQKHVRFCRYFMR
jgi:hypothetical protein